MALMFAFFIMKLPLEEEGEQNALTILLSYLILTIGISLSIYRTHLYFTLLFISL